MDRGADVQVMHITKVFVKTTIQFLQCGYLCILCSLKLFSYPLL